MKEKYSFGKYIKDFPMYMLAVGVFVLIDVLVLVYQDSPDPTSMGGLAFMQFVYLIIVFCHYKAQKYEHDNS
jgi:hypothetical protein